MTGRRRCPDRFRRAATGSAVDVRGHHTVAMRIIVPSPRWVLPLTVLLVAACGGESSPTPASPSATSPEAASQSPAAPEPVPVCDLRDPPSPSEPGEPAQPALRDELLALMDADQAERTGESAANNDATRAARLAEIIDEHGWPGFALVGVDGATAAWVIAQHADHDVDFQRRALELMCAAVRDGDADPTEAAYLEDRVAVNSGGPQFYGTQVGGCEGGKAVAHPIAGEAEVDQRRQRLGMEPLAEYLAQFDDGCPS